MVRMTMNLWEGRASADDKVWDLPIWGHPLARIVTPLFIRADDRLFPLGTAFWVGRSVSFILTAMHNVAEALKRDGRFDHACSTGEYPSKGNLKNVSLYILHTEEITDTGGRISLVPLESLVGGPPGDVVFGYPKFEEGRVMGSLPLSFDPPRIGETVLSVGYRNITPLDGLPFDAVEQNTFDWLGDYHHQFTVVEGTVERIFVQRFARGFLEGPCFAFNQTIDHGLSGGPVITTDGRVVGINSAGAELYFHRPVALGSMLYPLLATGLQFGAQLGPMRIDATRQLFDLIGQGLIASDGSETNVSFQATAGQDGFAIGPRIPIADHPYVHDDFDAFGRGATSQPIGGGTYYRLVRT